MAWVTTLGPDMAQVEYRLSEQCGCDGEHQEVAEERTDAQVDYRLGAARDLEWIGSGLADVGLAAGDVVDKDAARVLMDGRDPRTGEQLVKPKVAVDPRAKLQARGLVEAITAAAAELGVPVAELLDDAKLTKRFERLERGLRRDGDAHRLPVRDVDTLAEAAGVDAAAVYGKSQLAEARRYADKRIRIGNRGYDVTLDLPKSYSTVAALAGEDLADALTETFLEAARETVGALESWAGYAMAGEHGNGKTAVRVETTGLLGWMTVHRSARPVGGIPGDPHLHVHVSIANMALAADGKWRTIGAGGRDIHRHAHALDSLVKARLRELTEARFGMRWERDAETGAWEVVGVDADLRREFSRRSAQIAEAAAEGASTHEQKLIARQLAEGKDGLEPTDVRASWRERAEGVVGDVDAMVRAAVPGPDGPGGAAAGGPGGGPIVPPPEEIAAYIWREDDGLTAHRKVVTRADVLAAVIDACPRGLADVDQAEALTDAVLAVGGHAVALPDQGQTHLTNPQRYTHTSVLEAEQTIVETATARLGEGAAQITTAAAELAVSTFEASRGIELSEQQRQVVHRLLTEGHGMDVVVGVAGAGKTTLMAAARTGWEAAGLRVAGASTAAVAASNLYAEAHIASATVATWLQDVEDGGRGLMAETDVLVLDEAAMVDDRALARLLHSATEHGTKVVSIGDWQQLKAIGIGGGFRRAHELVDGLELTENRRQRDPVERAALEAWRDGGRRTALAALAEHGRIHAVHTPDEAYAAMLGAWKDARSQLPGDVHDQIEDLVMLAARNEDVEILNGGARELSKKGGELSGGKAFALAGGGRLELAAGDLVRIKRNDYRTRRGGDVDVLNGFRGVVTYAGNGGVRVQWRRPTPDGEYGLFEAWLTADQIAAGALQHGYAMTIASAQGLTSDVTLAYGVGAEANTLYPAISRARQESHLWLPADVVEDDTTRRRLGEARSEEELLQRAVAAYAAALERDQPDGMVSDELTTAEPTPRTPHQEPARERRAAASPAAQEEAQHANQDLTHGPEAAATGAQPQEEPRGTLEGFLAAGYASRSPEPAQPPQDDAVAVSAGEIRERIAEMHQRVGVDPEERARRIEAIRQQLEARRAEQAEPEFPSWRGRPYGNVPTPRLQSRIAEETAQARRAERQAEEYGRRAAAREAELAASPTPGQVRAAEVAAVLDQADRLAQTAQEEAARAQRAYAAAAKARDIADQVAKGETKGRIALWAVGTSRKEAKRITADFREQETAAYTEARRAQAAAETARREAWSTVTTSSAVGLFEQQGSRDGIPYDLAEMRQKLTAMRERVPDAERIANSAVARDARYLHRQAAEFRGHAETHSAAATELQQEKELRRRMETQAPRRHVREVEQRTAAIQAARQRRAEQARQATQHPQSEPPSQSRSGPSLGR